MPVECTTEIFLYKNKNRENIQSVYYNIKLPKRGYMKDWLIVKDDEIVCYCKNVSKETIVTAIDVGADTLDKIRQMTGACTGNQCKTMNPSGRCCSQDIKTLLKLYSDASPESSTDSGACCGKCSC